MPDRTLPIHPKRQCMPVATNSRAEGYQTTSGHPVRFYDVNAKADTVHGAYRHSNGTWSVASWKTDGTCTSGQIHHLCDTVKTDCLWLNIFDDKTMVGHPTKAAADGAVIRQRVACIQIAFEHGEGLTPDDQPCREDFI